MLETIEATSMMCPSVATVLQTHRKPTVLGVLTYASYRCSYPIEKSASSTNLREVQCNFDIVGHVSDKNSMPRHMHGSRQSQATAA